MLLSRPELTKRTQAQLKAKLLRLIDDPEEPLDSSTRREILAHIASADFSDREQTVKDWSRGGGDYVGRAHPSKPGETLELDTVLNSAEWHAAKHTAQGEWEEGTTTKEYLDDVRACVRHSSSILDVGGARITFSGSSASRYAPRAGVRTDLKAANAVVKKLTKRAGTHILTVYAIDTNKLASAYQLEASNAAGTVEAWSGHRAFSP